MAIIRGVRKAAILHRAFGVPMVGWKDGQVIYENPDDVIARIDRSLAEYEQSQMKATE